MVGLPKKIILDRDGRFISRFWKELFKLIQTRLAMSTSHHPQTDGQTEKANRTLEEMIRHYINYQQNDWDDLLPALEHAYNSSVHATTGLAPFMITFGQIPRNMEDILIDDVILGTTGGHPKSWTRVSPGVPSSTSSTAWWTRDVTQRGGLSTEYDG
jgi:hypothetical protein